jgi:hypothetical protein
MAEAVEDAVMFPIGAKIGFKASDISKGPGKAARWFERRFRRL